MQEMGQEQARATSKPSWRVVIGRWPRWPTRPPAAPALAGAVPLGAGGGQGQAASTAAARVVSRSACASRRALKAEPGVLSTVDEHLLYEPRTGVDGRQTLDNQPFLFDVFGDESADIYGAPWA